MKLTEADKWSIKSLVIVIITFIIIIIFGILLSLLFSCNSNPYEQYNCPCKIIDRKITKYGKTVTITNQDSMEYPILSDSLFEKDFGYIIK